MVLMPQRVRSAPTSQRKQKVFSSRESEVISFLMSEKNDEFQVVVGEARHIVGELIFDEKSSAGRTQRSPMTTLGLRIQQLFALFSCNEINQWMDIVLG